MEKIAKEYKKSSGNRLTEFLAKISTGQVILFGIVIFILIAFNNNQGSDQKYTYAIYFILIGIIAVLYFKPAKEKRLLPDYVAKEIAQEALNLKVREGKEFSFDSKLFVTPYCHLKYENDLITGMSGPVGWDVGFIELVHGTQYKKEGVVSIHPYEGIVTGITFRPLGYTGMESRDKVIIPVAVVEGKIKTTDYGKPGSPS